MLDVGITTLIPFILITIINLLIAYKLKKTSKLTSATGSTRNWEEMTIISNQNSNHVGSEAKTCTKMQSFGF